MLANIDTVLSLDVDNNIIYYISKMVIDDSSIERMSRRTATAATQSNYRVINFSPSIKPMDDPNKPEKPTRAVNWLMLMVILSLIIGAIGFYLYISDRGSLGPRRRFRDAPIRSFPKVTRSL